MLSVVIKKVSEVFSQASEPKGGYFGGKRTNCNRVEFFSWKLQEIDLFGLHQEKKTHHNNSISAESLHGGNFFDYFAIFCPHFHQNTQQPNFSDFAKMRKKFAIDDCSVIAGCHIHLLALNWKHLEELVAIDLYLEVRRHFWIRDPDHIHRPDPTQIHLSDAILVLIKNL